MSAWRAKLNPDVEADPQLDPDPPLPLVRPRPAARRVAMALVWDRDAETGRAALLGVAPMAMQHAVRGGRAGPRPPAEAGAPALVEWAAADAVDRALRDRIGALRRAKGFTGVVEPVRAAQRFSPMPMADRPARLRLIPGGSLIGIRPAGWEAPDAAIAAIPDAQAADDAVAIVRTFEARTAPHPIIADPAEASLVRVGRLLARRGALRRAFLRRAGAFVAGTLQLGTDAASVAWRRARA
ncbi:hypothetical protein [Methylobacterium sp. E-005]|uniref:hypothetical protein n=1 Tax=Methylobacterium sp. E-005 TaxID=2836549 RepID=UPI001FB9D384|nr:hypothetical protein [Methylobacterium sp. E-005]